MVLEEEDSPDVHPFVTVYAEALRVSVDLRSRHMDYSPVLEEWGMSLYDAVADDLRPVVLQLAGSAACGRPKRDVAAKFCDWVGRVELADWYDSLGLPNAAVMVREHGQITDEQSFLSYWPVGIGSFEWRQELDKLVEEQLRKRGLLNDRQGGAAEALAENGLIGLDNLAIAGRRESLRNAAQKLGDHTSDHEPLPERGDLWDLKALYSDPMWAAARPATRETARTICDLVGWDPESPSPPTGHPLHEVGFRACCHAAYVALAPYEHSSQMREIDAFRRIALGKPFLPRDA
jgi:hypothetical protein